jgi:hypothetical protein
VKKKTLLLLGAGAVALYFLTRKKAAAAPPVTPRPGVKGYLGQVPYQAWSGEGTPTLAPGQSYYEGFGTQVEAGYQFPYGVGIPYEGQYQQVYTGAPTTNCPYGTDQYGNCMAAPSEQSLAAACAAQGGVFNGTVCEITTPAPTPVASTPATSTTTTTTAATGTCPTGYQVLTRGGQSYCVKAPAATCDDGSTPGANGLCADGTYPEMSARGGQGWQGGGGQQRGGWQGGGQQRGGWQRGGGQSQGCQSTQYQNWFSTLCQQAGGTVTAGAAATATAAATCPSCAVGGQNYTNPRQLRQLVSQAGTTAIGTAVSTTTPAATTPTCSQAGYVAVTAAGGQTYCLPPKQAARIQKQWSRYASVAGISGLHGWD